MRDIKFRGQRTANGEWMYGDLLRVNEQTLIHPHFTEPYEYPEDFDENVDPETVGQFTDLKDRNGTEIYEGDILATSNSDPGYDDWAKEDFGYTVVEWDPKNACYQGTKWQWEDNKKENVYDLEFVKVIGNIYENTDLLTVQTMSRKTGVLTE